MSIEFLAGDVRVFMIVRERIVVLYTILVALVLRRGPIHVRISCSEKRIRGEVSRIERVWPILCMAIHDGETFLVQFVGGRLFGLDVGSDPHAVPPGALTTGQLVAPAELLVGHLPCLDGHLEIAMELAHLIERVVSVECDVKVTVIVEHHGHGIVTILSRVIADGKDGGWEDGCSE